METRENNEETLIFRYDRSRRLENAPQNVRDFYDGKIINSGKGLFHSLFGNKSSKFMFLTVLCLVFMAFIFTYLVPQDNTVKVENLTITLNAMRFEDSIYCSVEIPSSVDFENREEFVYAKFNLYDVNNNLVNSDFSSGIYSGEKKYFRCTFLDFEIKKVECELDFCGIINILNSEVK